MKIPTQKKIVVNDFPEEDRELVEQLAGIIDYNTEKVFAVLNHNVSFGDNTASLIKDIQISVTSAGIPTTISKFQSTFTPARPSGALVISAVNLTNSNVYPTGGIFVSYSELSGVVTINHITGLPVDNIFSLRIVFFA